MRRDFRLRTSVLLILGVVSATGCGKPASPPTAATPAATPVPPATTPVAVPESKPVQMEIPSISLSPVMPALEDGKTETLTPTQEELRQTLFATMKPVQIMLGDWHGTTQKEVGDFKGLDKSHWVWDLKTDRQQPAMVMTSDASPYIRAARLTYFPERKVFQLKATDPAGETRTLEGAFTQAAETFQGDDRLPNIKYKLELTQVDPPAERDAWQIVFNQQENHRFLLELAKKKGTRFVRVDTIATQREGTSFAKSDEGYGQRECVISGGLGTTPVSYKGTSYWVCCSGCKAAFEEEPEKWIAAFEKKKMKAAQ